MNTADKILGKFATPESIVTRDLRFGNKTGKLLINPDLSDAEIIRTVVLTVTRASERRDVGDAEFDLKRIKSEVLESETEILFEPDECINRLLNGDMLVCMDGEDGALVINARSFGTRGIVEPPTETVMRGPREGFIEDLKTNLSLIERRLKTSDLAIEKMRIGRKSQTNVAVCYISSIANPNIVKRIKERLKQIDIDGIVDSYALVPYIEEKQMSLFTQTGYCEKPDIAAAKMLEGRVAIFVDGSPIALTLPYLLVEDFQSSEDYYVRSPFATFVRLMRYVGIFLALLIPALYVALQNFHYSLMPVRFTMTIMSSIKGLPVSPLTETLFVILLFEIIREASVRMPRAVGMAMSIVGALVLGETAVNAGVISSPAVMVTALSSIALFLVPDMISSTSILRLVYTLVGGLMGLFGLIICVLYTLHYICSLNGYGTPYLAPYTPLVFSDFKDSIERGPLRKMTLRPKAIPNINPKRMGGKNEQ